MLDITLRNPETNTRSSHNPPLMRAAGRTAGSVPVWNAGNTENAFGFADLLDMVNPLQHIPVVSQLYRGLTGDTAKPISKILGGALYGGPAGAASGLVNVIAEEETGRDLAGNVVALALHGEKPAYKSTLNEPEARLETVLAQLETGPVTYDAEPLPAGLLAFAAPTTPKAAAKMLHNDQSRYNS